MLLKRILVQCEKLVLYVIIIRVVPAYTVTTTLLASNAEQRKIAQPFVA